MTNADSKFIMALLFVIAVEVAEMNLRAENRTMPTLWAVVGVSVSVLLLALVFRWV